MKTELIRKHRRKRLEELAREADNDPVFDVVEGKEVSSDEPKEKEILVYSQQDGIYAWPWVVAEAKNLGIPLNPIKLCDQSAGKLLMYVDKLLYPDIHDKGIFEINDDFEQAKYCTSSNFVDAMCIYKDDVVHSANSGIHSEIYLAFTDTPFRRIFGSYVYCMCEHNGHLFAGLGRDAKTLSKASVFDLDDWSKYPVAEKPIKAICSYNGVLYAGFSDKIKTVDDRNILRQRPGEVESMCVVNGKLLDAGSYGIYDTLADKPLVEDVKDVWTISPAPESFFKKKLRKLKQELGLK